MLNIAFYGKSGVGKSTITRLATEFFEKKGLSVKNVKLAYPLYQLQNQFYEIAGVHCNFFDQNQSLLEDIARHLRMINPEVLINDFNKRYNNTIADIVINDDIRDTTVDYPHFCMMNFHFIKIVCDENKRLARLSNRKDLNTIFNSKTTDCIDDIKADFIIDTSYESEEVLKSKLESFLEDLWSKYDSDR